MPDLQYFFAEGGVQRGPHTGAEIVAKSLAPDTLIWREGLSNWQRLDSLPELLPVATAVGFDPSQPPPVPNAQAYQAPGYTPGYQGPYAPQGYSANPPSTNRIVAGVFGILMGSLGIHKFILGYVGAGLIMCLITVFTCGYAGLIFGPIGLIEGIIYLSKSDEEFYRTYVANRREWF